MLLKRFLRNEDGVNAVLFALAFVVVLGIAALVVDYGLPAFDARKMQNAADSAAYAASQGLPVKTSDTSAIADIKDVAYEYMAKNGFSDRSNIEVTLGAESDSQYYKVTVVVHDTVDYTFARIFGENNVALERSAAVQLVALGGVKNAVPLSIEKSKMDADIESGNYEMILKYGGGNGANGDYGAIDLDGEKSGGANDYRDRLKEGYEGVIYVEDYLPAESGVKSGPTRNGVEYRLEQCEKLHGGTCTPEDYDPHCPRIMLVPVVTTTDKDAKVEGFAPFLLDKYTGNGNESFIYGTYLPGVVVDGELGSTPNPYGTYGRKLVE